MIFILKANLVPWYLLFLLILRHWEARRVPRRHSISSKTWCHGLSLISNNPHTRCEHLCIIFSASAPSGPNLFSITGIKVMTSGIAFDRPDRLSRLRAFPYDRFDTIVRRELNSIQAIEVVSVVRVVCDRLGSVSIWSSPSSEHFLRRLGRSGRSYETRLNVGNDDYIVLCNFDGLIISGLEAEEGRGLRTSPRPFTVAGSKKLTGLNFLFPSPIHTIWNRIPRSTGSPSQLCNRIEILISDWLVMEIFSIHFEIKCENFFICNTCVWHLVPSYRCPIVDYSEVLPWFVQLCRVTRLKKG